jgi:TATA-box binding protein (TBP) (component of TFIID and TFIIIB)
VAPNATKIAGDVASEAQQIAQAISNIPIDVQNAISSYINVVTTKLEAIAQEMEQCVRNYPPS